MRAFPLPRSQLLVCAFPDLAMHHEAPGIIVIANPDIMALQSDRATPGAARTITLRPGCWWKSCIRETSGPSEAAKRGNGGR